MVVCLLLAVMVALLIVIKRRSDQSDDWEIEYDELEVGEQLGAGGYGAVHKATWKGTEVAVKVMASEKITKDMEKNFKDEVCSVVVPFSIAFITDFSGLQVRVMTALRHPNVVLFMAASTKAPKMCIVMEFMTLGSLYDVRLRAVCDCACACAVWLNFILFLLWGCVTCNSCCTTS